MVTLLALRFLFFLKPMACSFVLFFAMIYEVLVTEIKGSAPAFPRLPPGLVSLVTPLHLTDLLLQTKPLI